MSVSGGYHKAAERGESAGCDTVQIFTTAPRRWPVGGGRSAQRGSLGAKPISALEAERFVNALKGAKIRLPTAHASYLINLASPDRRLWKKSVDAMVCELQRCETLQVPNLVVHPGSHMHQTVSKGLARVSKAMNEVFRQTKATRTRVLLETTAGQGTNLGYEFEQLATIMNSCQTPERLGVCLDTCHMFAAGIALDSKQQFLAALRRLDRTVGLKEVLAIHVNDSKGDFGSRVDRHAGIGKGKMGLEPFRHFMNERRLRRVPMYLETPKGVENGEDLDQVNLRLLRSLVNRK